MLPPSVSHARGGVGASASASASEDKGTDKTQGQHQSRADIPTGPAGAGAGPNASSWKTRQKHSAPVILALAESLLKVSYVPPPDGPPLCLFSDFDPCPIPSHPAKHDVAMEKYNATIQREKARQDKEKEKKDRALEKEMERVAKEKRKLEERESKERVRMEKQREKERKKEEEKERKRMERMEMGERRRRVRELEGRDDVELEWEGVVEGFLSEEYVQKGREVPEGLRERLLKAEEGEVDVEGLGLRRGVWPVAGVRFLDVVGKV